MTKDEVCKRKKDYFKEMFGDDGVRNIGIDTIRLEVRRVWNRYRGEESITMK